MGCACISTMKAKAGTPTGTGKNIMKANQKKDFKPQGDVNLPTITKRYSEKNDRRADFGRLSVAFEQEKDDSKQTEEEDTKQIENPEFYLHVVIGAAQNQNSLDTAQRLVDLKTSLAKLEYTIVTQLSPNTHFSQYIDVAPNPAQMINKLTHQEILRHVNRRYRLVIRKIINIGSNLNKNDS